MTVFVLSSSQPCLAQRAAGTSSYCSLPGVRKQAQGFAELPMSLLHLAAASLSKISLLMCCFSLAAFALLHLRGGGGK